MSPRFFPAGREDEYLGHQLYSVYLEAFPLTKSVGYFLAFISTSPVRRLWLDPSAASLSGAILARLVNRRKPVSLQCRLASSSALSVCSASCLSTLFSRKTAAHSSTMIPRPTQKCRRCTRVSPAHSLSESLPA